MAQATLSPELTRQSIALARALSSASRNWGLYPPEHPTVEASVKRLAEAINRSVAGAVFTFGVTPKTLMVAGYPLPEEQSVTDAARLMHDHDILQMTFVGEPDTATLHALLALLGGWFLWWWSKRMKLKYRWVMLMLYAISPILVHGTELGRPDHQSLLMVLVTIAITPRLPLEIAANGASSVESHGDWQSGPRLMSRSFYFCS